MIERLINESKDYELILFFTNRFFLKRTINNQEFIYCSDDGLIIKDNQRTLLLYNDEFGEINNFNYNAPLDYYRINPINDRNIEQYNSIMESLKEITQKKDFKKELWTLLEKQFNKEDPEFPNTGIRIGRNASERICEYLRGFISEEEINALIINYRSNSILFY